MQKAFKDCKMDLQKQIKTSYAIAIILMVSSFVSIGFLFYEKNLKFEEPIVIIAAKKQHKIMGYDRIERPKPPAVSMKRLKAQGCVADGLLSEYHPENDNFVELINRSNCYYLHRAIETWLKPPDFETVGYVMNQMKKKDLVYGMFIAEAIDFRAHYLNELTGKEFDFRTMCRGGSEQAWGEGSCKPTFASGEYREYIQYITSKAIDAGVQSFTFGQIYMQEDPAEDRAPKIVANMRKYAKEKGVDIVIGAQTGAIEDENYLKLFDYIEGGVGLDADGNVEDGPCYSGRGGCWALLWHDNFASKANNVLLHLDWTGIPSDDLDIFARMTKEKRAETLKNLYVKFSSKNMGFMMPYFGVLYKDNGGCYGPKKRFYSPDNDYSCKDENAINKIISGVY
ncbi:MAG: hypothetical protein ACD_9C00204G0002 [uncultured bacterium]|nr:MAG: hypothetical protein ACD_9C00204G0002 [uncultured bacterium]KKQ45681.1 MAG: hypothetical protein US63_C0012G0016 [Candidatus Moranbacteria bacterium GW2011_GWC2_37_8]KKQ62856.1 MAG: hypothetical protein US82_C0005G0029 [Parcubacteria group bacterium GW2011_GWC1_38_22]KKQ81113.1 MAG: hypothetical protein UT03_C0012G0015 [Candidatus Moranbacteria bacterium GW2011_GWD2_38_7]